MSVINQLEKIAEEKAYQHKENICSLCIDLFNCENGYCEKSTKAYDEEYKRHLVGIRD